MLTSWLYSRSHYLLLLASILIVMLVLPNGAQANLSRPVIVYYLADKGDVDVDSVPWQDITQVNIAFAGIDRRGQCAFMDLSGADHRDTTGSVQNAIVALIAARDASNPSVKLVLSVGGWTMSYRFSEACATAQGTWRLANSCVAMVDSWGLDGVDYDWEYPGSLGLRNCPANAINPYCASPDDGIHLTRLLKDTRHLLGDAHRPLSVAMFASRPGDTKAYDYRNMDAYLTFCNIMAYDINAPSYSPKTSFNGPISDAKASLAFFKAQGMTPEKLNLGIPLYAYRYQHATSASVGAAVGASARGPDSGQYSYRDVIATWGSDPHCSLYQASDGDFYYCNAGPHAGDWLGVDTPRVAQIKAAFVRDQGYGGAMFWVVPGDTRDLSVTRSVTSTLAGPK